MFLHLPLLAMGPTHLPVQWVHGLFPGSKAAGAKNWAPTPPHSTFTTSVYFMAHYAMNLPLLYI